MPDGALARLGTLRLLPGTRVRSLRYSPDGKLLATGGEDHKVRVWDTATGKELLVLDAGKEPHNPNNLEGLVEAVAFLPGKGNHLATGSNAGIVRLWDGRSGRRIAELPPRAGTGRVF